MQLLLPLHAPSLHAWSSVHKSNAAESNGSSTGCSMAHKSDLLITGMELHPFCAPLRPFRVPGAKARKRDAIDDRSAPTPVQEAMQDGKWPRSADV